MKRNSKNVAQRALAAGAILVMLGASGCTYTNEQSTALRTTAGDGLVRDLGPVLLRNILVVADDEGTEGRLAGTVFNTSDEPVDLSISAGSASGSVTIDGGGQVRFEDDTADDGILQGLDDIPGSLLDVDFEVEGEEATFQVPVVGGSLEEYREFVPGGYTPRPSETAAEEAAEGE